METKLNALKFKKARLFSQIEMLSTVSDSLYLEFGKTCAEIIILEKTLIRNTQNPINEN